MSNIFKFRRKKMMGRRFKYYKPKRLFLMTWIFWEGFFKVLSAIGPVAVFLLIYWQIQKMQDQTNAIWYSMRPCVSIAAINDENIIAWADSETLYTINYTIRNRGISPAILDTTYIQGVFNKRFYCETKSEDGRMLTELPSSLEKAVVQLDKGSINYLAISIVYKWDYDKKSEKRLRTYKHYSIEFLNDAWTVRTIRPSTFKAIEKSIPDSLHIIYIDWLPSDSVPHQERQRLVGY